MAKPHKFAWNGVDIETGLSFEQVANLAQRAAQESTGDLLHGKHRIASVRSSERQIEFRINDFLITFKKFLVFHLDFESRGGRTWVPVLVAVSENQREAFQNFATPFANELAFAPDAILSWCTSVMPSLKTSAPSQHAATSATA